MCLNDLLEYKLSKHSTINYSVFFLGRLRIYFTDLHILAQSQEILEKEFCAYLPRKGFTNPQMLQVRIPLDFV